MGVYSQALLYVDRSRKMEGVNRIISSKNGGKGLRCWRQ